MIDVETDIYDRVARAIIAEFPDAYVSGEHVDKPASFPAVSVVETSSALLESTLDSSGEEVAASLTYTVDAYSLAGKAECRRLVDIADGEMRAMNFTRLMAQPVDNARDPTVYRMVARYAGVAGNDGNLYTRR